jgi:hypothetical protein
VSIDVQPLRAQRAALGLRTLFWILQGAELTLHLYRKKLNTIHNSSFSLLRTFPSLEERVQDNLVGDKWHRSAADTQLITRQVREQGFLWPASSSRVSPEKKSYPFLPRTMGNNYCFKSLVWGQLVKRPKLTDTTWFKALTWEGSRDPECGHLPCWVHRTGFRHRERGAMSERWWRCQRQNLHWAQPASGLQIQTQGPRCLMPSQSKVPHSA